MDAVGDGGTGGVGVAGSLSFLQLVKVVINKVITINSDSFFKFIIIKIYMLSAQIYIK